MPSIPILMPQLGESIAEATIICILIEAGGTVEAGSDIFEVETNKATMAVTAPCSGKVSQILAVQQTSYAVGSTLGTLEITEEEAQSIGISDAPQPSSSAQQSASGRMLCRTFISKSATTTSSRPASPPSNPSSPAAFPVPAEATGASYISPRMRARMLEPAV